MVGIKEAMQHGSGLEWLGDGGALGYLKNGAEFDAWKQS